MRNLLPRRRTQTSTNTIESDRSNPAYQRAVKAAAEGDAAATCVALMESPVLDGLRRRLMAKVWWEFSGDDADDVIADAFDDLFVAMTTRPGPVANPGGLLWQIVYRRAVDHARRAQHRADLGGDHEDDRHRPDLRREAFDDEAERLASLRRALPIARALLPKLGNTTMQVVMGYWFDAAERGVEVVEDAEVAAAFGYTTEQVRKAHERGFARLARIARDLGVVDSIQLPGRPAETGDTENEE